MLSHPIVRTAAGLVAAGALTGALAPVVLAHGAHASAQHQRAHAVLVVDRPEDTAEQAAKQDARQDQAVAKSDADKAKAAAAQQAAAADRKEDMAEAQAIRARIQAALAREDARETQIKMIVASSLQQIR